MRKARVIIEDTETGERLVLGEYVGVTLALDGTRAVFHGGVTQVISHTTLEHPTPRALMLRAWDFSANLQELAPAVR